MLDMLLLDMLSVRKAIPWVVKFVQASNSKLLLAPEATWLLTGVGLFKRESESSRPFFRPTGGTVMVGFGPRNLTCEIESAGAGGGIAVTLCQQRDVKTPGQLHGRAFPLTVTGDKVRQIDFGSPGRTRTSNQAVNTRRERRPRYRGGPWVPGEDGHRGPATGR